MALKLTKRGWIWYLRGTVRGIPVYESARTASREHADVLRIKREAELLNRSVHGEGQTATFLEAAVSYMETVQPAQRKYVGKLLDHFGTTPLANIDQAAAEPAPTTM